MLVLLKMQQKHITRTLKNIMNDLYFNDNLPFNERHCYADSLCNLKVSIRELNVNNSKT